MWPQEILKKRAVVYSFDFCLGWNERQEILITLAVGLRILSKERFTLLTLDKSSYSRNWESGYIVYCA